MSAETTPRLPVPGDVILGRYTIEHVIGEGGMGVVLRAHGANAAEAVAIKVLSPEASAVPEAIPRFVNEAQATRQLNSQHVVKIYDAGTLDSGLPFIVMELLDGSDLSDLVQKTGRLRVVDAVDYMIQACDAIAEAHAQGIVHRDLKPSNLFLTKRQDGSKIVKVLDFGISKMTGGHKNVALTGTGTFLGSPHYMSPEQLKSAREVDARADIWSIGAMLYELLLATLPFDARGFGELFMAVLTAEPKAPREIRPDLPAGLEAIVVRCLKKNRDERYSNVTELVKELAQFASPAGQALAQRIASGAPRVAPAAGAKALAGTMLMSDAPSQLANLRRNLSQAVPLQDPRQSALPGAIPGATPGSGPPPAMINAIGGGARQSALPMDSRFSSASMPVAPRVTHPGSGGFPAATAPVSNPNPGMPTTPGTPIATPPPPLSPSEDPAPATPMRTPMILYLGIAVALAVIGIVLIIAMTGQKSPPHEGASPSAVPSAHP